MINQVQVLLKINQVKIKLEMEIINKPMKQKKAKVKKVMNQKNEILFVLGKMDLETIKIHHKKMAKNQLSKVKVKKGINSKS